MSNQRPSFAKRDREMKLKDKAKAKAERREARKSNPGAAKGPPIAFDEAHVVVNSDEDDNAPAANAPAAPQPSAPQPPTR